MTARAIQLDYGEFDSRFLGVNLKFHASHPSTWELFDEIGTDKRDPKKVMELGSAALKESPERAFEVFSVGTVLTHEMRHFHDFLLSPYGNALFRLRLTMMLNGFQVIFPILRSSNSIPVPFPVWISKNDVEKKQLVDMWSELRKTQCSILDVTPDEDTLIKQVGKTHSTIKDFLVNPQAVSGSASFQPYHLWEASAFNTQFQNVFSVFGHEHAQAFGDFILNHPSAEPYSIVFRLLYNLWYEARVPFEAEVMNAIVTWCLLGDFLNDGWDACPTVRFARLFGLLRNEGPPRKRDVAELFQEWTERFSYTPISTALSRNEASTRRFIEHLETNAERYPDFMESFVTSALHAVKTLHRVNGYLATTFLRYPKVYVNPYDYVQNQEIWPAAPAISTFVGGGILITKDEMDSLNRKGMTVHRAKSYSKDPSQVIALKVLFPNTIGGVDLINTELALEVYSLLTMTDFFFSEFNRVDPEFDWVRSLLEENNVTALEIFV
jgi:hypothetical protein